MLRRCMLSSTITTVRALRGRNQLGVKSPNARKNECAHGRAQGAHVRRRRCGGRAGPRLLQRRNARIMQHSARCVIKFSGSATCTRMSTTRGAAMRVTAQPHPPMRT
jgi:hypothetical protein